ncbi:hornerin-like [Iris pallida]|uniref:Hornerin-like n=1 Tax=Iris pallida TaxID=29817 RepID=A0AAX6DPW0_IRIPA|nr:hornerin-like [Iris pallida]
MEVCLGGAGVFLGGTEGGARLAKIDLGRVAPAHTEPGKSLLRRCCARTTTARNLEEAEASVVCHSGGRGAHVRWLWR